MSGGNALNGHVHGPFLGPRLIVSNVDDQLCRCRSGSLHLSPRSLPVVENAGASGSCEKFGRKAPTGSEGELSAGEYPRVSSGELVPALFGISETVWWAPRRCSLCILGLTFATGDLVFINFNAAGINMIVVNSLEAAEEMAGRRTKIYSSRPYTVMLSDLCALFFGFESVN